MAHALYYRFLSGLELRVAKELARVREPSTVRDYIMAPLLPEDVMALPTIVEWLGGAEAYGAYFVRYPPCAKRALHRDPVDRPGMRHSRCVVLLEQAARGGSLLISGSTVDLADEGDACFFYADSEEHEVTTVLEGERVVLTVGCLRPGPDASQHPRG